MKIDHVEIAKLALELGDILVVKIPDDMDPQKVDRAFREAMREADVRCPILIGTKDAELQILKAPPVTPA